MRTAGQLIAGFAAIPVLSALVVFAIGVTPARPQDAPQPVSTNTTLSALPISVALEDGATGTITIQVKQWSGKIVAEMEGTKPGSFTLDLSALETNSYALFVNSPGYATRFIPLDITNGTARLRTNEITLYRTRYAILRYSVNTVGARSLQGSDVDQGRCAVAQWGAMPYFHGDWQIVQRQTDLYLEFHRFVLSHGFALPPEGLSFEQLGQAPPDDAYECKRFSATKGLVLYCRVHGNSPKEECYGKLLVEDVTEQPPPDLKIFNAKQ